MDKDELKEINTDIIFLGIAAILSILLFLIKVNQKNRLEGHESISRKKEADIVIIIRFIYLFVALYFLIEAFNNLNKCKQEARNNIIIDNAEKGLWVSFFIFIASLVNVTTSSDSDEDNILELY